jgi:hypothetical protein
MIGKKLFAWCVFQLMAFWLIFSSWANFKAAFSGFSEGINPVGRVHFKFINETTGEIRDCGWSPNLVVTTGKNHIADQLAGRQEAQMSHMAIGTGTTAPVATDTALQTELDRNALDSRTQGTGADANKVTYVCTWPAGDGTGAITEAAIFNSASAGQMLCRSVFPVKNKEAGESMVQTWILTVSA